MKSLIYFLLLLLSIAPVNAQDFENYQTLLSQGDMPDDFKLNASEKFKKEWTDIKNDESNQKDKSRKRNFALESSFAINDMMMSGRVIYGDKLGSYINKIADEVLKNDTKLRNELRFYIIKSTIANAFSTNQGIIFITSGLIAQVENEAQLAFIIAHEIVHYTKKHNYEQFKKRDAILKGAGRKSTVTIEEKLRSLYKYSKNHETEADSKGMELFLSTDYNPYAAITSFDVLLYSYLPYDMIEWKPNVFESENYIFPENYISETLEEISADEDEDDKKRTHPNMGKRKSNLASILSDNDADSAGKKLYLVSKDEFNAVQKIARFELASLYIKSGNPAKAYYIAYLLDKTYGSNTYTDKIKSMALYSLCRHATYGDDLDNYGCNKKEYEGEVQQVAFFFTALKSKDLSVLTAKYLWDMSSKYPKDEQLTRMRDQTFTDMFTLNGLSKHGFSKFKPAKLDTAVAGKSKVDKLKNKQKSKDKFEKYYYGAFYELLKEKKFKVYFDEISQNAMVEDDEDSEKKEIKEKTKKEKQKVARKKQLMKHEDIVSVVLFKPQYQSNIFGKSNLLMDEIKEENVTQYYKEEAKRADIEVTILDQSDKDNFDTEAFNNFSLMNDWFLERVSNDTLTM
ncbi:MAG: M48 family metallopeptidase, partial [Ferruginibacter sp.]